MLNKTVTRLLNNEYTDFLEIDFFHFNMGTSNNSEITH